MRSEEWWKGRTTYKAPHYYKVTILLISSIEYFLLSLTSRLKRLQKVMRILFSYNFCIYRFT